MSLKAKSVFLYGFQITAENRSLDFRSVMGGPVRQATLSIGYFSLAGLMRDIKRALETADPAHTYTVTADRTVNGGTENRVTILTSGIYLDLLFASGPRSASTCAPLIGFLVQDFSGLTSYTGTASAGTPLVPEMYGYNYTPPEVFRSSFGSLSISANGTKEAIVWNIQKFFEVNFKFEPEAKVITEWSDLMSWMIQQKPLEFTPEISNPTRFFECTLETTPEDQKGMSFKMKEQLPDFPFNYQTGQLKFRVKET